MTHGKEKFSRWANDARTHSHVTRLTHFAPTWMSRFADPIALPSIRLIAAALDNERVEKGRCGWTRRWQPL